jgi:hypothetical protein
MHHASYYREQAERARRLARQLTNPGDAMVLASLADDLDAIAIDLERGAVEIKRPDLLPQH